MIKDYGRRSTFSSFLPGISGKLGIPIWCFYVNRGQAVACFGVEDKDHSIMEFFPAHQAYQYTKYVGFRTFCKIDGTYYEPFGIEHDSQCMFIGKNELEIQERTDLIQTNVLYYTLPKETLGGLVRKVTIQNIDTVPHNIEILDGMPAVIPYGVNLSSIKEMGQTCKAWMQVEDVETNLPYYKVRASMEDSVDVHEVKSGHFYFGITEDGEKLPVIVDPQVVFDYDTSLTRAKGFEKAELSELLKENQVTENNLPCGFFARSIVLGAGQSTTFYQVAGLAKTKQVLKEFADRCSVVGYFEERYQECTTLTDDLCKGIRTKSADATFDAYCEQTYLDNLLRGGYPINLSESKVFYVYSRKHGDMERDYNFFSMLPEFYSQGNANFRDANQNRRCDVLFSPYVKEENLKTFYNLIQIDGYNPLAVQKETYRMGADRIPELEKWLGEDTRDCFKAFIVKEFTPGSLLAFARETLGVATDKLEDFLSDVVNLSEGGITAEFGEGYWSDHWTYNLDLIETYLSIYPEQEKEILFNDPTYTYFESKAVVNPRKDRYVETERGIRQYRPLNKELKKQVSGKKVRCEYGKGDVYYTTLMEKLLLLSATKFANLDSYGMGIEMEAGKPGWYDALNGLPGIFGSSMAETYELHRMLEYIKRTLQKYQQDVEVATEIKELIDNLDQAVSKQWNGMDSWNAINQVKEQYREKTVFGIEGSTVVIQADSLVAIIEKWLSILDEGINRAISYGKGISPTYFSYEVTSFDKVNGNIIPREFEVTVLPYFLEGPVRYLKLSSPVEGKKALYQKVKASNLYDRKLSMYKINESLKEASFEAGRAMAFTPGWLENESIWLHMEYKYLLELLRSGLYEEYFEDFHKALIPFLDEDMYGRSILENSSFIASSANPNDRIHGKGFVARLSGSTAEFIHMWQIMMFGKQPFRMKGTELILTLEPAIPEYLIPESKQVECTFLGNIEVTYQFAEKATFIPGSYTILEHHIEYENGSEETVLGNEIPNDIARSIRAGKVKKIRIVIE
jgi:hypothetical protein